MTEASNGRPQLPDDAREGIRFVTPGVTSVEQAAVIAVLSALIREESAPMGTTPRRGPSAWERSQRALRTPLQPGHGAWRSFTG